MRVLVTGGAGSIGSEVVRALVGAVHEAVVTADTVRIRAELGWTPVVTFEAGMAEFATA